MRTADSQRIRRGVVVVATGAAVAAGALTLPAQAATTPSPAVTAKGGYVTDGSGADLYAKGADTPRSTGSTTKIMTAEVVLSQRHLDLDDKVTVQKAYSDYIVDHTASSAHLIVGDRLTVRQLLYAMMLPSGCDAAYALADHFGSGTTRAQRVESFVAEMNSTAAGLGLRNTHFDSFDGIGNGENHSTPRDLTALATDALRNATFAKVAGTESTKQEVTTSTGGHRIMSWTNTNTLLGTYPGVIGVKTGSGPEAGYCLVFAAVRDGRTVVGTVLDAPNAKDRTADVKKLLDRGFAQ
ncbi:D-alanyl-D-alanine carboxypeptidase family protein [Streptomyces sp. NPDC059740]|uniref:D-alanyl-D-alanine carboxypeptidase family protein n=1 Tax=Streptomyces sp. NPDC059740 TaxID=3346926 RepID=UPI0036598BA2